VLVAVDPAQEDAFTALCDAHGVPHAALGVSQGAGDDAVLEVEELFSVPLAELRTAWTTTLPAALDD
jgi:phosphoribosylformylglycinamidine synthase